MTSKEKEAQPMFAEELKKEDPDVLNYCNILNIPQADERNRIVERKEVMLFSAEAYHEAVVNAFVHNRWIDGNGPMFTGFQNRIEILSRGGLPPKQTMEGFFAGESVPVNNALSRIFIQLHITEHTGRGIPKITEVYGRDHISIHENSIVVTISYDRLDAQVEDKNAQVKDDNVPVKGKNAQVTFNDQLLEYCITPKSSTEIMKYLHIKSRRTLRRNIKPLIESGRLTMTIPDKPSSRFQKYVTIK